MKKLFVQEINMEKRQLHYFHGYQQEEKKKLSDRLAANGHWFPKISHKYILLSYFTTNMLWL